MSGISRFGIVLLMVAELAAAASLDPKILDGLEWRNIGPAVMGGRISDIDAIPGDPSNVLVAAGSGGLFRTGDGGITWKAIFDHQSTISIGAIAMEPGNPKVIWVGTGESNVRNSVSFGDGLYKTEDAGASWAKVGLGNTETISRIVVDPKNPAHVYVAALGHPFGPNEERGVFVTQDGGKSWRKTLYIDPEHGAADIDIDPQNPNTAYAAMWKFDRKPWTYTSGDDRGGLFKSVDGGLTWKKLAAGLPHLAGRMGVKVAPSNAKVLFVVAESKEGTLFRSNDAGETFTRISDERELVGRGYYFSDLRVAPDKEDHILVLADSLLESKDGGHRFRRMSPSVHGDLHALWIDPKDPRRIWQGNDGGLAVTYDAGAHWEQVNNLPLGQFYQVSTDDRKPFYHVTAGMQDNGSWTGPARTREPAGIFNDDWRMVNQFVGFHSLSDPDDPDILLTEQPGGALLRTDLRTREQQNVSPQAQSYAGAPARDMKYRFNWDAPLVRSPFGKRTMYLAGNVIFQSSDYGKSWETISRDLTNHDESKLGNIGGPIWTDNSASEVYATISALAESPAKQGVLWAGTDDGNLQVTLNGGGEWTNVASHLPVVVARSPVSHVEPSTKDAKTAYVSFDRHMFDDFHPYIYETGDSGRSWKSIASGLPEKAFVWTVREDPQEPGLLYAGTELGIYARWPGSTEWLPLHLKNMPWSVAVRDIQFEPSSNDIILATHGRSLFVLDDATVLQQLAKAVGQAAYLFPVRSAMRYAQRPTRFAFGDKTFTGPNPPYGALITYFLSANAKAVKLEIEDEAGSTVRTIVAAASPGLHRVAWDLRYAPPAGMRGAQALPGQYKAHLTVDGRTLDQPITINLDPGVKVATGELKGQFEISSSLLKMEAAVNAALERAKGQEVADVLARPSGLGRSETGPRLKEKLEALFTMIDTANAAPTEAQARYFYQLTAEYNDALSRVKTGGKEQTR